MVDSTIIFLVFTSIFLFLGLILLLLYITTRDVKKNNHIEAENAKQRKGLFSFFSKKQTQGYKQQQRPTSSQPVKSSSGLQMKRSPSKESNSLRHEDNLRRASRDRMKVNHSGGHEWTKQSQRRESRPSLDEKRNSGRASSENSFGFMLEDRRRDGFKTKISIDTQTFIGRCYLDIE